MLKKLIASASAAAVALSTLTSGLAMWAPVVTDPELIDAVSWAYDTGLTKYSDADAFMSYNNLTREQFAKFASQFGTSVLNLTADTAKDCTYADASSSDSSLNPFIMQACQMGVMMGYNGNFMPKQLVTRGQVATVVSRMLGGIDAMSSEQAHFDYLNSLGVMKTANLNSAITRGDALLMLYRVANGSNTDLCTIDPTLPGCTNNGTGTTNTGTVVKAGDLQISMNPASPANNSYIPKNGVSTFGKVDFTAGSKDVTINTVTLARSGLGTYSDIKGMYFENAGVKVSSRSTVSSDNTATVSFSPAITIAAGKTISLDIIAELSGSAGGQHMLTSTMIDSTAANLNGKIVTPTLITADYAVRGITFTNLGVGATYNGNETTVELGKFQLQNNGGATAIDTNVKAITLRNVGNSSLSSITNLVLMRGGVVVSTNAIVNGRDVTFVLSDTVKDGQSASYTIQATVSNVDNAAGDSYKFILRQSTDLNAVESTTSFRNAVSFSTTTPNDSSLSTALYVVNGGQLRLAQDSSALSQASVSPGSLQVVLLKGTITAKQAILLEDPTLSILQGTSTVANFANKYTLTIGNSSFTWTPSNGATSALFQGSVTVNGTVNVQLVADVRSNAVANTKVQFGTLQGSNFARAEYVSTQNAVTNPIGSIAGRIVTVTPATLDVSRNDGLTNVKTTNNAQGKILYGIRLTNSNDNDIKVGSITLSPTNNTATGLNNDVVVDLKNGSTVLSSKTLNGDTVFNGLNLIVKKGTPVDLTFVGNFLSVANVADTTQFAVKFSAGDAIDNVTANNVMPAGVAYGTAIATSTATTIIGGGTVQVTNSSATPSQGFVTPASSVQIGSFNVQAINDDLELRGLYLNLVGSGVSFAAQVGNQISNVVIKDQAGNVVASESSRGGSNNELVKFNNFVTATQVAQNTTKRFDVFATVNPVTSSSNAGEFTLQIATGYTDAQYPEIYNGTRILSVNAGTYVAGTSVTATSLTNALYVVASYPVFNSVDLVGSPTKLIEFKITNPSTTTNLSVSGITYFQTAQVAADVQGKPFKVYNGSTVLFAGNTAAGTTGSISFSSPLTIAPGSAITLVVQLDNPFTNTAGTPTAGNRKFQITNASYSQTFTDGSTSPFADVGSAYINQVGLNNLTASY